MKNTSIIASAAMLLAGAAIASANPFSDVPASHWAYQAVNSMAEKGIIQGFPNGTFKGNQNVTRYQLAMITAKMIANVENCGGSVSKTDLQTLEKLTVEFADELALLGVKVTALEDDMQVVKEDVAGLKKDVDGIKSYMKNGGVEKVKLSGDMLVRNYGFHGEIGDNEKKEHKTESLLRLQLDAQVDENITARARWNMIENDGDNEWHGFNKSTGEVEVAYLQIKDMFGFGGDFKFGRDWLQHGHGFVMHNYTDAVNYTKRCGDVDLALNVIFERQGLRESTEDTYNVWNINADYSYKGHDMYLGIYHGDDVVVNADNKKRSVVEFGSTGKLTNNNDKVTYDIAAVYSTLEDGKLNNGKPEDEEGWLGHVAVNYDSKEQLTAKIAYTFADDESNAAINAENYNSYLDRDQTIFEDIMLASIAGGNSVFDRWTSFKNLKDIKVQVGYTLKNADKHSFRLAYDNVQNDKDDQPTIFNNNADLANYLKDVEANIITFEYQYKLAENTRIRLGYQNSKIEGKNGAGASLEDVKSNLFYTEIYSRF